MFSVFTNKISPDMCTYIKDQTNKSLERYRHNNRNNNESAIYYDCGCGTPPPSVSIYYYVPFLSLFSFLAGYHFSHILKNIRNN